MNLEPGMVFGIMFGAMITGVCIGEVFARIAKWLTDRKP